MIAPLGILANVAQSTAIPLLTMSVMLRGVYGPAAPKPQRESPLALLLSFSDAFEPETAPIWDTQMPVLQKIHATPFPGIELRELEPVFARCEAHFPEIFEGSTFADWLAFCARLGLLLIYRGRVLMSSSGKKFMESRVANQNVCACG